MSIMVGSPSAPIGPHETGIRIGKSNPLIRAGVGSPFDAEAHLLINAIQHGGWNRIRVTSRGDDNSVFLEVHNLVAPIPKEKLPAIFDPLFQVIPASGDPQMW